MLLPVFRDADEELRIVLVVRADDGGQHVLEEPREDAHRVLGARVLGIRLHAVEAGLGADTGDLELGDERSRFATEALDVGDGTFGREKREPRQVLDVALVEDDEPARPMLAASGTCGTPGNGGVFWSNLRTASRGMP